MTPILQAKEIRKVFGGLVAIDDVSFDIYPGRITALIGPNGAGKTTIFNLITGVYSLSGGDILYKGKSISRLKPHQIAARGVARTFQNLEVFNNMTALDNVMVGRHIRSSVGWIHSLLHTPRALRDESRCKAQSREFMARVGLESMEQRPADALPFGDQRRLELSRALAAEPDLLLLDEPVAGLSNKESARMLDLIGRLKREGLAIFLVEHDMSFVMEISDTIIVLDFGKKIAEGAPREVQNDPVVIEAYLGREED